MEAFFHPLFFLITIIILIHIDCMYYTLDGYVSVGLKSEYKYVHLEVHAPTFEC